MSEAEGKPSTPESSESTGATSGAGAAQGGAAGTRGPGIDYAAMGASALRIFKDPAESLGALHRPGQTALVQGLVLGIGSAVLIPLVQFLLMKLKMGTWYRPSFGSVLESCLGGVLFAAAGVAVGYILRGFFNKAKRPDWRDDVYLFGSPMVYLLAGTVVACFFLLIGGRFFMALAWVVMPVALIAFVLTYQAGLSRVGGLDAHRAICTALTAISAALIVAVVMNFQVVRIDLFSGFSSSGAAAAEQYQDQMREVMEQLQRAGQER